MRLSFTDPLNLIKFACYVNSTPFNLLNEETINALSYKYNLKITEFNSNIDYPMESKYIFNQF